MKTATKAVTATITGALVLAMLSGCGFGSKTIDGTKTVATINGEEIPLGIVSLHARRNQAQTEAMYRNFLGSSASIWNNIYDETSGITYGEETVQDSLKSVELYYLLRDKAADYSVTLTEEDSAAIKEAATSFMEANTEETIKELGVDQGQVETYLELLTYQNKTRNPIMDEADTTVDEAEAAQASFTYSSISFADMDDTQKEETRAKAQQALDALLANPLADMLTTLQGVDETYTTQTGTFTAQETDNTYLTNSYSDEIITALRTLSAGKVYGELVESDSSFYILRLDSEKDEDATASKIESMVSGMRSEYYTNTTDAWLEDASVTVNNKVLKGLTITDSHSFTLVYGDEEEESPIEIETEAAVEGESEATTEVAAEGATAAAEGTAEATTAAAEAAAEATTAAAEVAAEATTAAVEGAVEATTAAAEVPAEATTAAAEGAAEATTAAAEVPVETTTVAQ